MTKLEEVSIEIKADTSEAVKAMRELETAANKANNALEKVNLNKWKMTTIALISGLVGYYIGVL